MIDENGIPRFQLLQRFQKQPTAPTLYYIFDILWSEGEDITANPLWTAAGFWNAPSSPRPAFR